MENKMDEEFLMGQIEKDFVFLSNMIITEQHKGKKIHELMTTMREASVKVCDPATAVLKLAVENYFGNKEISLEGLSAIQEEINKIFSEIRHMYNMMYRKKTELEVKLDKATVKATDKTPIEAVREKKNTGADLGETVAHHGEIPIKKNVLETLRLNKDKPIYLLLKLMRQFYPTQRDGTVEYYLREHMKELGITIHVAKEDWEKAGWAKKEDHVPTEKKKVKHARKIKGKLLKGTLARKIGETYATRLTEERYLVVLKTVRDNPSIHENSIGKASGLSQNSGYAHLRYGIDVKDISMKDYRYNITEQGLATIRSLPQSVEVKVQKSGETPAEKKISKTEEKLQQQVEKIEKKAEFYPNEKLLLDSDALYIHMTYDVPVSQQRMEKIRRLVAEAFNYRITYERITELTGYSRNCVNAHVRYGIRKKEFSPCGNDEKGNAEICSYAKRKEIIEIKKKKETIIKVQSKSILNGEKKEEQKAEKNEEGPTLWERVRGAKKDTQ